MPKKKFKKKIRVVNQDGLVISENQERRALYRKLYTEKYFNKFLSKFEYEGITYQQYAYTMRKLWARGTVGCGKDKNDGTLFFAPYAPSGKWNTYDYPVGIYFINVRNVSFIPSSEQELDKDAVIGFIQRDRKGVYELIYPLIEKLVDIEMTIYVNLKAVKNPLVVGVSPEDSEKKEEIIEQLDNDNPYIFMGLTDLQIAKAFVSGANYNIDKLEQEAQVIDNQILSMLGINNLGVLEKKEHLTVNEVNANNQMVATSSDEFEECLNEFFTNIEKTLQVKASIKLKAVEIPEQPEEDDSINKEEE